MATPVVSQIFKVYVGRSFNPAASPAFQALRLHTKTQLGISESYYGKDPQKSASLFFIIQWPRDRFQPYSTDSQLQTLLKSLSPSNKTTEDPELIATVAFADATALRKAFAAPLFQLCTIELKDEADRDALTGPLLKTFTDCYFAPGFTGGDWGPDMNVSNDRLNWYFLGWETRQLHDEYQATDLFWLEVNKLMPHMSAGWAHFIKLQRSEELEG